MNVFTVDKLEALPDYAYSPGMSPNLMSLTELKECCLANDLSLEMWNLAMTHCIRQLTPVDN
jgi:hypothetical protein